MSPNPRSLSAFASRPLRSALLLLCTSVALPVPAYAVSVLEASRQVVVSTFIDVSGLASDSAGEGLDSPDPGDFLEAVVDGTGFGDLSVATGEALQESTIDGGTGGALRIDGAGSSGVVVDVQDPGQPSQARGRATSLLSVLFEVEAPSAYALGLSLRAELAEARAFSATASVLSTAATTFELVGAAGGTIFSFETRDDTAFDVSVLDDFALEGVLAPDVYRFELLSDADLQSFENAAGFATAGWGVSFVVVPEPSSALLVGLGLAGLAAGRRREPAAGLCRERHAERDRSRAPLSHG